MDMIPNRVRRTSSDGRDVVHTLQTVGRVAWQQARVAECSGDDGGIGARYREFHCNHSRCRRHCVADADLEPGVPWNEPPGPLRRLDGL